MGKLLIFYIIKPKSEVIWGSFKKNTELPKESNHNVHFYNQKN